MLFLDLLPNLSFHQRTPPEMILGIWNAFRCFQMGCLPQSLPFSFCFPFPPFFSPAARSSWRGRPWVIDSFSSIWSLCGPILPAQSAALWRFLDICVCGVCRCIWLWCFATRCGDRITRAVCQVEECAIPRLPSPKQKQLLRGQQGLKAAAPSLPRVGKLAQELLALSPSPLSQT